IRAKQRKRNPRGNLKSLLVQSSRPDARYPARKCVRQQKRRNVRPELHLWMFVAPSHRLWAAALFLQEKDDPGGEQIQDRLDNRVMCKECREARSWMLRVWKNCWRKVRLGKQQQSAAWKMHSIPTKAKSVRAKCRRTTFPKSTLTRIEGF